MPPDAASVCEYATLTSPAGRVAAVVMLTAVLMLSAKGCDAEPPPLSVTLAVKLNKPVAVVVPVIAPPALNESPVGRDPEVMVQVNPKLVPPDAASECE